MHVINLLLNLNLYVNYSKNVIIYMYGAWVLQKHLNVISHTHTHTHVHTYSRTLNKWQIQYTQTYTHTCTHSLSRKQLRRMYSHFLMQNKLQLLHTH